MAAIGMDERKNYLGQDSLDELRNLIKKAANNAELSDSIVERMFGSEPVNEVEGAVSPMPSGFMPGLASLLAELDDQLVYTQTKLTRLSEI